MHNLQQRNAVYQFVRKSTLSSFYHNHYGELAIQNIVSEDDWQKIPCITKEHIRGAPFLDRLYVPYPMVEVLKITSGTSGKDPLVFPRIQPPRYHNHFDREHGTACILNFFPPQHLMQHGRDAAGVLGLTVIDGDPAHIDDSVGFAMHAGLDHIMCTPSLIDVMTPILQKRNATHGIKRIELGGERVTPSIYNRLHENFPNAFLWADYGMTETQGVAGVGAITERGAYYTPTPGYYWEILDERGLPITEAGQLGELVISHTEHEGIALPLLRYKTGDYAQIIRSDSEKIEYEVTGRIDLDYIKLAGGEIRIEEVERAVMNIHPLLSDDFELHAFSKTQTTLPYIQIKIAARETVRVTDALAQECAERLAAKIRVSPTRTYAHGVLDGLYGPLQCTIVAPFPKSHWKRRRMFQHE